MEQSFYYADFDWTVTIDEGKSDILADFTEGERQGLQLSIWHAISNFMSYRALKLMDLIDHDKIRGSENAEDDNEQDGG